MVEDATRGDAARLGGAVRAGKDERRAQEGPKLGLQASIAVRQPLDPLLLPLEFLTLAGLPFPGLGELLLELAELPARNADEVVFLWGDEEEERLGERSTHASSSGNSSSMKLWVEWNKNARLQTTGFPPGAGSLSARQEAEWLP
jgi:hypothetical protein